MSDKHQAGKLESSWLKPIRAPLVRLLDNAQPKIEITLVSILDNGNGRHIQVTARQISAETSSATLSIMR